MIEIIIGIMIEIIIENWSKVAKNGIVLDISC